MIRMFRMAAVVVSLLLTAAACGDQTEPVQVPASADLCKGAAGNGPKIGMAYDVGGRDDRGLNDLAFAGLSKAVKRFHATCIEGEAAEGELESARLDRLNHFIDTGATTIIAVGSSYDEAVNDVAQAHPRVRFAVIEGADPDDAVNRNVAYLDFAVEEGSYLVGAAAALTSTSHTVGFLGLAKSVPVERSEPYESGFRAGAEAARPGVKVVVTTLDPESRDPEAPSAAEAAAALFDGGADVVFAAPGIPEAKVFDAAADAGDDHWAVGVGADQYVTATEDQRPHVLTSMIKRFDTVTYDFVASVARHRTLTGRHVYGVRDKGVGYATSGGFVKPIVSQIDEFAAQIVAGDVRVRR